jgi:hypothetical protein
MIESNIKATGKLNVVLHDAQGKLKEEREINNLVVSAGLNYICSRMKDATDTAMGYMAVGTGSTAASAGDTTLGTEADRNAVNSITVSSNTIEYVASWAAGDATAALTEAGIFNDASAGTMLARVVFDTVNKGANDTLTITWTITLSAS